MNSKSKYFLPFFLGVLLLPGCRDIYEPEGLDNSEKIIVINGKLDDYSNTVSVSVFYASAFQENINTAVEAIVTLKDNSGNSYALQQVNRRSGNYRLNLSDITLQSNLYYYITVETTDGKKYQSAPQLFPGKIETLDLNAEIGEKTVSYTQSDGNLASQNISGLYLYESAKSADNTKKYIRFENTAVYQSMYSESRELLLPLYTYCVEIARIEELPVVQNTFNKEGLELIESRDIGFLKYVVDYSLQSETITQRSPRGWVVISDAYSMSKETFNYYKKIENQLSANDKIFDPQPSQIIGNLTCTTNADEVVLGNFEISRHIRKYFAFLWFPGRETYQKMELETYTAPVTSMCDTIPVFEFIDIRN